MREKPAEVLQEVSSHITCDELIDYWFSNDAYLNDALFAELASIRAGGTQMHLATVQEHERARYIWEKLNFRTMFDGLHYSAELGCSKPFASFYQSIERRTCFQPWELVFTDDKATNVEGAKACGWTAALWTGETTLRSLLTTDV